MLVERDDGQQRVARQGEVLGYVGAAVPVAVFLPHAVIALVMVAVLNAPMPADGVSEIAAAMRFHARDEVADVLVGFFRFGRLFPHAPHFEDTTGAG